MLSEQYISNAGRPLGFSQLGGEIGNNEEKWLSMLGKLNSWCPGKPSIYTLWWCSSLVGEGWRGGVQASSLEEPQLPAGLGLGYNGQVSMGCTNSASTVTP